MLLKNVDLNETAVMDRQYPSIYVDTNQQLKDFANGYLSEQTLNSLYSNIFDFFYTFKFQHFHQGHQVITLDDKWDAFIKANKQYFRFNPKNNTIIYLQTGMNDQLRREFQDHFTDNKDKLVFEKISAGLNRVDLNKIKYRLKEFNPVTANFLLKIFSNPDLAGLIAASAKETGSIIDSALVAEYQRSHELFYSEQLKFLSDHFSDQSSGMPSYTEKSIRESLEKNKLTLINYLLLLNALETSKMRQQKYKLIGSRLYLVNPSIAATEDEISHLTGLFSENFKGFIQCISSSFFSQTTPAVLKQLSAKSIAVGGGKGGVGKSLTSVNLALSYSMRGYRTAIVDIDPTSNISIILDLRSPENMADDRSTEVTDLNDIDRNTFQIGKNLDILFAKQKFNPGDSLKLMKKLFLTYLNELNEKYDILILDMPAGNHLEDNLAYTPFVDTFLLVTNSEPAARKSGGGYLKSLLELDPDKRVIIWHNQIRPGFETRDFISSYNSISPVEEQLDEKLSNNITDLGYIPETSYLKVTDYSRPDPQSLALNLIGDILRTIETKNDTLKEKIQTALSIINDSSRKNNSTKTVERVIIDILNDQTVLNEYSNNVKLLISYYTLLLISSNNSIIKKINEFIPHRDTRGNPRDKHRQIIELLAGQSKEKEMAAIMLKLFQAQLTKLKFNSAVIPDPNQQQAIINDFATEVLYSGMGVLAPLGKRRAAEIFRDQSKQLLKEIGLTP